jgi:hypothetical protein
LCSIRGGQAVEFIGLIKPFRRLRVCEGIVVS